MANAILDRENIITNAKGSSEERREPLFLSEMTEKELDIEIQKGYDDTVNTLKEYEKLSDIPAKKEGIVQDVMSNYIKDLAERRQARVHIRNSEAFIYHKIEYYVTISTRVQYLKNIYIRLKEENSEIKSYCLTR